MIIIDDIREVNRHFLDLKNYLKEEIKLMESYDFANNYLNKYDWYFITPYYLYNYELNELINAIKNNTCDKGLINKIIFNRFYDISYTVNMSERFKNCSYICPFMFSVENSLISCYQKDYEGAIKTLIPIIEGIMRNYLITKKSTSYIKNKTIDESFNMIRIDIEKNRKEAFSNYFINDYRKIIFTPEQINLLCSLNSQILSKWFDYFNSFWKNSFWKESRMGEQLDSKEINRHSILHEFGKFNEYNLENYIKIYFMLLFFYFIFSLLENENFYYVKKEGFDAYLYLQKINSYYNICKYSENIIFEKHLILKGYPNYKKDILTNNIKPYGFPIKTRLDIFQFKIFMQIKKFLFKKIGIETT